MGNIKIPSKNLIITGNHIYKGYYAEYRSRIRQGEFLVIHLGCNGHEAILPIGNIIFIMPDGRFLQYRYINNGLSLFEVGKEEAGEIIVVNEEPDSPSVRSPLYLPEPDLNLEITEENEENEEIDLEKTSKKKYSSSEKNTSSSEKYAKEYNDIAQVLRQEVPLDSHPVTELLSIFFRLAGFTMDNVAINSHSTLLKEYLSNSMLESVVFNTVLYKTFVIAYVFIYINNLNIGYPIAYPGCKMTPNDNPSFLLCVAIKSKFIEVNPDIKIDINYQIVALLKIMGTKIVPANPLLTVSNRFSLLRIDENGRHKVSLKKSKLMRFPLLDQTENLQITTNAKNIVNNKISNSIKNEKNNSVIHILETFVRRFDYYISGPGYRQLIMNPMSLESNVLLPFVKEYKKRVDFEKDKFYDNMSKTTILNNLPKADTLTENLKAKIISELNSKISDTLHSGNLSSQDTDALHYVLNNSSKIVDLTVNDIKDLNISIISANENQASIMSSIITYKSIYDKLLQKFKREYSDRVDNKIAHSYRQAYMNTLENTKEDLRKRQEAREKRRSIDSKKIKIFEQED